MELMVVVKAIQDVVRAVLGANASSGLQDTVKILRDMVFPEWSAEDQSMAKKKEELLKREFESGPIKLQSTSYEPEKKRKTEKRPRVKTNSKAPLRR